MNNLWTITVCLLLLAMNTVTHAAEPRSQKPNVIFILADDLGYRELGCYGQKLIKTPNLDKLASQGTRLMRHYSGAPVCAPSRCILMTGKHPGHATIRNNGEVKPEGQRPLLKSEATIASLLQQRGYATGAFGKWGLGFPGSVGEPMKKGFDRFFGYNCQRHAHSFYPGYLWDNDTRIELNNKPPIPGHAKMPQGAAAQDPKTYDQWKGKDYAADRIINEVDGFIRKNKDQPFFCYYPTLIPHLALHVPDEELAPYLKLNWKDPPDSARYTPHYTPRAAYAAMITRLDKYVGRIMATLDELEISDRTIVVFSSDNGATYLGPMAKFFDSVGELRGLKGQSYEGGLRVPAIVRFPGRVPAGGTSNIVSGFEDWLPTILELVDDKPLKDSIGDGVSIAPTLTGNVEHQSAKTFMYREFSGYGGHQAVWLGEKWKGIRTGLQKKLTPIELYDLSSDPGEKTNVADAHPKIVTEIENIMKREHVHNPTFSLGAVDAPNTKGKGQPERKKNE